MWWRCQRRAWALGAAVGSNQHGSHTRERCVCAPPVCTLEPRGIAFCRLNDSHSTLYQRTLASTFKTPRWCPTGVSNRRGYSQQRRRCRAPWTHAAVRTTHTPVETPHKQQRHPGVRIVSARGQPSAAGSALAQFPCTCPASSPPAPHSSTTST